jgi:hypothetical protein
MWFQIAGQYRNLAFAHWLQDNGGADGRLHFTGGLDPVRVPHTEMVRLSKELGSIGRSPEKELSDLAGR